MIHDPALASARFGLGPRADERIPHNVLDWLEGQLADPAAPWPIGVATLEEVFVARQQDRAQPPAMGQISEQESIFRTEVATYALRLVETRQPFRERLAAFWQNHFTVSRRTGAGVLSTVYLRDAIEPHVTGRFVDMFQAVMRHPAMLEYLNNVGSIGPGSRTGQRQGRGLNENLAREAMELFSVSPAAGYSQADVTQFARILTGWSVVDTRPPYGFLFRPAVHEPGTKTLMGRSFSEGEEGGTAAITMLGTHPATYRHLAEKLVRHFVADAPPPAAVAAVAEALQRSGGALPAAYAALLRRPEAWALPCTKLRTPQDFLLAAWRLLPPPAERVRAEARGAAGTLGQGFFLAPQPNGWPDRAVDWATPELLLRRIDWAWGLAGRAQQADARALAEQALGPMLTDESRTAIARAGSPREALTLLLSSPEFQRR